MPNSSALTINLDSDDILEKIEHGFAIADFCRGMKFPRFKMHGLFMNEHNCSVGNLANGRFGNRSLSSRRILCMPLNHYPIASLFGHAGIFVTQPSPGLERRSIHSLPNLGYDILLRELPKNFLRETASGINGRGSEAPSAESTDAGLTSGTSIRLLESHVEKALSYGLLPRNSIFCVIKIGHYDLAEALEAAGHNVVFRLEDIGAIWRELQHAFLTWQILNGVLRGCRFIGLAGAANLFSAVPIECLYLYEFSDKFGENSISFKTQWQRSLFGTEPLFDTPSRSELVEAAKIANVHPYSGIHRGYKPQNRVEEIVAAASDNPGVPNLTAPAELLQLSVGE